MATSVSLAIDQGQTFSKTLRVKDSDGNRVDLTGFTSKAELRDAYGATSSVLAEFATSITEESPGDVSGFWLVTIQLTAAQTSAIPAGSTAVYDVEVYGTGSGGEPKYRVAEGAAGQVVVTAEVTLEAS